MEQTQLQAVWEQILTKMKETLAESAFKWFKSVKPLSLTDDGFVLSVQNDLVKDWITSHYLTIVEDAVSAVLGSKHKVSFQVVPEAQPEPEPAKQETAEEETAASHSSSRKKKTPIREASSRTSRPLLSITATCTSSRRATARR